MRPRVVAVAAVAVVLVSLLAAPAGGLIVAPDTGQPVLLTAGDQPPTWNGTFTPGPEAGSFRDGIAVEGGGYLLVGSFGPDDGTDPTPVAMRVDDAGNLEWAWSLGGYGNGTLSTAVQVDDDLFLVAGTRRTPDRGAERFVAALTDEGEPAWRDTYGEGRINDAVRVPNGGALFVGGRTASVVTPNGTEVWTVDYEAVDVEAAAGLEDGYVLAGVNDSGPRPARELRRIDGTGDEVWRDTEGGAGPERYTGVAVVDGSIHAVGEATVGDPDADGAVRNPAVMVYHPNGTADRGSVSPRETSSERVTGATPGRPGVVVTVRRETGGRLLRFVPGDIVRSHVVEGRLRSVTAAGDGRYLVTGDRDGEAYAAVLAPGFEEPVTGADGEAGSGAGESERDVGAGSGESTADGSGGGVGAPALPLGPIDGVPRVVTLALVVAAAIATGVAVAVTVIAVRRL